MPSFDLAKDLAMIREHKAMTYVVSQQSLTHGPSSKTEAPEEPTDFDQVICTDGACAKNGRDGALAGVGVYFGPGDTRNISAPLTGALQTNNRAEMQAMIYALEYTVQHPDQKVHIQSDSSYCVNGFKKWIFGWVASNWVKLDGRPVLNRDMWEQVWKLKGQMKELNVDYKVSWVRGHDGHEGNEAADQLAVKGVTLHPRFVAPVKKSRSRKKVPSKKAPAEQNPTLGSNKRKIDLV